MPREPLRRQAGSYGLGGPVLVQQQSSVQSVLLQQHQPSNFC